MNSRPLAPNMPHLLLAAFLFHQRDMRNTLTLSLGSQGEGNILSQRRKSGSVVGETPRDDRGREQHPRRDVRASVVNPHRLSATQRSHPQQQALVASNDGGFVNSDRPCGKRPCMALTTWAGSVRSLSLLTWPPFAGTCTEMRTRVPVAMRNRVRKLRDVNLPPGSRGYRETDLFSLIVEIHRALYKRRVALNPAGVAAGLEQFFQEVDKAAAGGDVSTFASMYYRSTVRAAIDRANRVRRGQILQSILDPPYAPQLKFATSESLTDPKQEALDLQEGDYEQRILR